MRGRNILFLLLIALNIILGYHLFSGDQGLFTYLDLKKEHEQMAVRLLEADRRARDLSRTVWQLKSDKETVKNTIRARMNYVAPGEIVYIFTGKKNKKPEKALKAGVAANENKD